MVPVSTLFDFFPRMIRDIGRENGKEVQLVLEGSETEIDRQDAIVVADQFNEVFDPVKIHMVKRMPSGIFVDQSEGRAGNIILLRNIEPPCQALHKSGFAASEVTGQSDDDGLMNPGAQSVSQFLGFRRGVCCYPDVFFRHGLPITIRVRGRGRRRAR